MAKKSELKEKKSKNSKLKIMAIAYEFSRCHGYGIQESKVDDMWGETSFEEGEVDTTGIDEYSGNSTSEIASYIVREILSQKD